MVRERLASLLYKAGALNAMMQLRRFAPLTVYPSTLPIVTYHHIADEDPAYAFDPNVSDATPTQFRSQLEWLAKHCNPIGVDELVRAVEGAPLPKNPVMVTFDDGYKSCHDTALPILRAVGVRATFFIATNFIVERKLYWWERIALVLTSSTVKSATITYPVKRTFEDGEVRSAATRDELNAIVKNTQELDVERFLAGLCAAYEVPWSPEIERDHANNLIMTWDEVRALARAGMDIESHGKNHRVLQTLDDATLDDDLAGSRHVLEAQLGRPIRAIAYPVGRRVAKEERIRRALERAGYRVGLSNMSGVNRFWPQQLRGKFPLDRWDISRLATDRAMSNAMYSTQVAIPPLAYINHYNR